VLEPIQVPIESITFRALVEQIRSEIIRNMAIEVDQLMVWGLEDQEFIAYRPHPRLSMEPGAERLGIKSPALKAKWGQRV